MEKKLIKYHIKTLQFVKPKWFSTNPCVEIVLPQSGETVRLTANFDYASLYDRVMPTLTGFEDVVVYGTGGEFNTSGIEPLYQQFYERRTRGRRPSWRDYVGDFNSIEDEQPF